MHVSTCDIFDTLVTQAHLPERIRAHGFHKIVCACIQDPFRGSDDASVGEEDVESPILLENLIHEILHIRFLASIDLASVDLHPRVQTLNLSCVNVQQVGLVVTDVDCGRAVASKLVGSCSADAIWRVGSSDDHDLVLDATLRASVLHMYCNTACALETYAPMVSVAIVGMFGTPSNDPRSAGFLGFASCSLKAFTRALELIDMIDGVQYSYKRLDQQWSSLR